MAKDKTKRRDRLIRKEVELDELRAELYESRKIFVQQGVKLVAILEAIRNLPVITINLLVWKKRINIGAWFLNRVNVELEKLAKPPEIKSETEVFEDAPTYEELQAEIKERNAEDDTKVIEEVRGPEDKGIDVSTARESYLDRVGATSTLTMES